MGLSKGRLIIFFTLIIFGLLVFLYGQGGEQIYQENELKQQDLEKVRRVAKEVSYSVKFPTRTLGRELQKIEFFPAPEGMEGEVVIYFEEGLQITIRPYDLSYSKYEESLTEYQKERIGFWRKKLYFPVKIYGYNGLGREPGKNPKGVHSYNVPKYYPGMVMWYERGVLYTILGDGMKVDQLLIIAESMKDVNEMNKQKGTLS